MSILSLHNISKSYGRIQALNGVSFDVPAGSVFGILGPNGSGKTTLLGIVTNILNADSGTFTLFDGEPNSDARKKWVPCSRRLTFTIISLLTRISASPPPSKATVKRIFPVCSK
ncbi:ATP-binding cassette domain-containing protein [Chitinophaga sedimenti]|uniref:ATP-binding cassette domain-containing protein n=1 Tax=Chitinophaga sedimenti TaxID=2033606 RepID=UPI003557DEA8